MTSKPRVLVLMGGTSDEREVSMRSGESVARALGVAGYSLEMYDPADGLDILPDRARKVDVVFPVLHGLGGEDGKLQALLESHDIPFVGAGSATSELCFDKLKYKRFLQGHDFPTPGGELVDVMSFPNSRLSKNPYVLKPFDGGSSVDTFIVRDTSRADSAAMQAALARHSRMLIEELIGGTEITVAMLGNQALPVIEIIPPDNQEFDYENKYNGATQELCPPPHVSPELQKRAQELSASIHTQADINGMSRTDIIIDANKNLWVLETNTIPGMTDQSLLPKAAAAAGVPMPELVDRLVQSALNRV